MKKSWFCAILFGIALGCLCLPVLPPLPVIAASVPAGLQGAVSLASMKNTRNYISYGADSTTGEIPSHGPLRHREAPPMQDRKGYIEYRSGPSRFQEKQMQQQEQADRENSWRMLQNLFINLPAPPDGADNAPPQTSPSGK